MKFKILLIGNDLDHIQFIKNYFHSYKSIIYNEELTNYLCDQLELNQIQIYQEQFRIILFLKKRLSYYKILFYDVL